MVQAAAVLLAASAASAHLTASRADPSSLAPTETATPVADTDAFAFNESNADSSYHELEARCYDWTKTKTVYQSTATVTSFASEIKGRSEATALDEAPVARPSSQVMDETDGENARDIELPGPDNDDNDLQARHCYHYTYVTETAPATTVVVVETPVSGTTITAAPTITHDGQAYVPVTTVSKAGGNRLRPGFW